MLSLFLAKALGVVVTLEWSCAFCTAPASIIKAFSCWILLLREALYVYVKVLYDHATQPVFTYS